MWQSPSQAVGVAALDDRGRRRRERVGAGVAFVGVRVERDRQRRLIRRHGVERDAEVAAEVGVDVHRAEQRVDLGGVRGVDRLARHVGVPGVVGREERAGPGDAADAGRAAQAGRAARAGGRAARAGAAPPAPVLPPEPVVPPVLLMITMPPPVPRTGQRCRRSSRQKQSRRRRRPRPILHGSGAPDRRSGRPRRRGPGRARRVEVTTELR